MIRSIIPMVLLSGLTLGSAALAAEPTPATTQVTYSGMKVAIDAKTGQLRPLTAAESRQLDLNMTAGRGLKMVTMQQALASKKQLPVGGTSMKLAAEQMTTITATQHADGSVTMSESGTSQEVPSE